MAFGFAIIPYVDTLYNDYTIIVMIVLSKETQQVKVAANTLMLQNNRHLFYILVGCWVYMFTKN